MNELYKKILIEKQSIKCDLHINTDSFFYVLLRL